MNGKKVWKVLQQTVNSVYLWEVKVGEGCGAGFYLLIKMLSTFLWYLISFNKHKDFQANLLLKYNTHTEKYTIVNTQLGGFSHREHTHGASIGVSELVTTQLNC